MLMGGLFGRSVGALCHALGLTESLSGEEFWVQRSFCQGLNDTTGSSVLRNLAILAGVYAVVGSVS
jgi:hypothetical protein